MSKASFVRRRILAVFSLKDKAGRDMFSGLLEAMSDRFDWELHMIEPGPAFSERHVRSQHYDGFIVTVSGTSTTMQALSRTKTPTVLVDISDPVVSRRTDDISFIWTDNIDIGRRGAEHLLSRVPPCSSYGFVHEIESHFYSREREMAFRHRIREEGMVSTVYQAPENGSELFHAGLHNWLKALPKPAGVMTVSDMRAEDVINVCLAEGIDVPNQVCVIGVDDDRAISARSPRTISSVLPNFFELGRQCVHELDFLFRHPNRRSRPHEIVIPAQTVIRRQSSASSHINVMLVENAQDYIRSKAETALRADDVACHLGRSRPFVERKFKEITGQSLRQAIEAERLKRAAKLHKCEHLSVQEIADRLNFTSANQLSRIYMRHFGQSLSGRRSNQAS